MFNRLYVDNYKCLVNCEWHLDKLTLLAGPNGAGKTALLEVLQRLQQLLRGGGQTTTTSFPPELLTRWETRPIQRFELDLEGDLGLFRYSLAVEQQPERQRSRVLEEKLLLDDRPLFEFREGQAQLYHDDFVLGPQYPFDWTQSGLAALQARHDNQKLTWFKGQVANAVVIGLNPFQMASESHEAVPRLGWHAEDFAGWFQYISHERMELLSPLNDLLKQAVDGFISFSLPTTGERSRSLRVLMADPDHRQREVSFLFDELSAGERVLLVLHTLMAFCEHERVFLAIDEPDNFLALPEIQPWLIELKDRCLNSGMQTVLISHHPELLDYLAVPFGVWAEREPLGPTRLRRLGDAQSELPISELVARGWLPAGPAAAGAAHE